MMAKTEESMLKVRKCLIHSSTTMRQKLVYLQKVSANSPDNLTETVVLGDKVHLMDSCLVPVINVINPYYTFSLLRDIHRGIQWEACTASNKSCHQSKSSPHVYRSLT